MGLHFEIFVELRDTELVTNKEASNLVHAISSAHVARHSNSGNHGINKKQELR